MLFADLLGKHILVVEDDYLQANALGAALEEQGSEIVGPFPGLEDGLSAIEREPVDAAVLDIQVNETRIFPLADRLAERGIPFVFVTGYNRDILPARFHGRDCIFKPVCMDALAVALATSITKADGEHGHKIPPAQVT
ncbi:response regulator [Rhizobium mesoamericanum]|uniref:Putative two-component response regulator protein n=1 Tax=Rhizobium mesoamericanum STM3625 TaxID=1211777 RepID=K0Q265_9HYPH